MNTKLAKLNASAQAAATLERMLHAINLDFEGGKITKTQLLNWILIHFEKQFPSKIEQIRKENFDHLAQLESIVKKAKKAQRDGNNDSELEKLVVGLTNSLRSNNKKTSLARTSPAYRIETSTKEL